MKEKQIRLLFLWLAVLNLGAASLRAQTAHGQAYAIAGPGNFKGDRVNYAAVGGEYIARPGVGVAGEISGV